MIRRFCVVTFAWLVASASCAAMDPATGRYKGGDGGAGVAKDDYAKPPPDGGADPRCAPAGGVDVNDCDGCETAHCCATRFGCYDDHDCKAADEAFDACLDSAQGDAGAVKPCWETFSASGALAHARFECEDKECKAVCGVP
jgi:hypothetical protein